MGYDYSAYPISLWPDELAARRDAGKRGYGEVSFWAWGEWQRPQ